MVLDLAGIRRVSVEAGGFWPEHGQAAGERCERSSRDAAKAAQRRTANVGGMSRWWRDLGGSRVVGFDWWFFEWWCGGFVVWFEEAEVDDNGGLKFHF